MDRKVLAIAALLVIPVSACSFSNSPRHTVNGSASCVRGTTAQYLAAAKIAFEGVILRGPVLNTAEGAMQVSPARVRVTLYLKGNGPKIVTVKTALERSGEGLITDAEGITPKVGQHWIIYAVTGTAPFSTSVCAGSKPIGPVPRLGCCGMSEGELLIGDGVTQGIVRIGDTVRRPMRPFSLTIQAYLAPRRFHWRAASARRR